MTCANLQKTPFELMRAELDDSDNNGIEIEEASFRQMMLTEPKLWGVTDIVTATKIAAHELQAQVVIVEKLLPMIGNSHVH